MKFIQIQTIDGSITSVHHDESKALELLGTAREPEWFSLTMPDVGDPYPLNVKASCIMCWWISDEDSRAANRRFSKEINDERKSWDD